MGLFSAIKSGLQKTREALLGELKGIVGVGKITDETLEDLEEHLSNSKSGVDVIKAGRIISRVKQLTTPLEMISKNLRK